MSFAVASLGSLGDTAARSTYTCSVTGAPGANTLVLVGVLGSAAIGTPVQPSSVSGCGMVFSLVTSSLTYNPNTVGSELHNLSVWRSMTASPVSSVVSALFGVTGTGCAMHVLQVSGVSTSGASGANAVAHSIASRDNGSDSALTATGPSAASTANAWVSFAGISASAANDTPGQNWTLIDAAGYSTPSTGLESGWTTLSTGTTAVWSGAGANRRAAIVVEIVLDNPSVVTPATTPIQPRRLRIPYPPSGVRDPAVDQWMNAVAKQLNQEGYISLFSGADPNTSGFTGIPGNLLINIGSASTWTRLWGQVGSVASISTTSWHPFRVA